MFRMTRLAVNCGFRVSTIVGISALIGTGVHHKKKHINEWLTGLQLNTNWSVRTVYLQPPQAAGGEAVRTVKNVVSESFPSMVSVRQFLPMDGNAPKVTLSTSSGFIIEYMNKKCIVTTARAVGNAKQVRVKFTEIGNHAGQGTTDDGKPAGAGSAGESTFCNVDYRDPVSDIAFIDVPDALKKYTGLRFADLNDKLRAGDPVVIAGHAWDYKTVNRGVVSWPNRLGSDITKIGKKYDFIDNKTEYIQHTASFAIDDYGGPLMNMKSSVIGMYFYLQLIDNIVMYFAIPHNKIIEVMREAYKLPITESKAEGGVPMEEQSPFQLPKSRPPPQWPPQSPIGPHK
ncbi:uncharacterized serine protease syc0938_d-like [Oppia nitens]|uniref:uncharacterized serine protease syc0938_d-like n=1 Tax=Oppia nitens TaxID=1686743 RepID=UPI0023DAFFF3|nr:uncharacterized serine protease syc0938_d-like [Oppia nitens]